MQEAEHRSFFLLPYWKVPVLGYKAFGLGPLVPRQESFRANIDLINDNLDSLIKEALLTRSEEDVAALEARDYDALDNASLLRFLVLCFYMQESESGRGGERGREGGEERARERDRETETATATALYMYMYLYTHTHIHTHTHTYKQTYMHTYIHTNIHICIHACMHTYIDVYIHISISI